MKTLFLDAPYTGDVCLCQDTIDYLQKNKIKSVGLYGSVQFCHLLTTVTDQLTALGITIVTSMAKRTSAPSQLLGCDTYHNSLNLAPQDNFEVYLYVGDGKFHPLALVYAQKDQPNMKAIICNDPIGKQMHLVSEQDIATILRKYRGSLIKFLSADTIGILSTIKPGQEQFRPAQVLIDRFPQKKFYNFVDNNVSFDQLENFPFVDVWVNTTCPRVGFDDQEKFSKGVINLNDALHAAAIVSKESVLTKL